MSGKGCNAAFGQAPRAHVVPGSSSAAVTPAAELGAHVTGGKKLFQASIIKAADGHLDLHACYEFPAGRPMLS